LGADRTTAVRDDTKFSAVRIYVPAANRFQSEGPRAQQLGQPEGGPLTESCFVGAFGSACFRRVNVSDPDLLAAKPEGVTVDDAVAGAPPT
jgi:hypothetical protein